MAMQLLPVRKNKTTRRTGNLHRERKMGNPGERIRKVDGAVYGCDHSQSKAFGLVLRWRRCPTCGLIVGLLSRSEMSFHSIESATLISPEVLAHWLKWKPAGYR